jgi:hypothetical protein
MVSRRPLLIAGLAGLSLPGCRLPAAATPKRPGAALLFAEDALNRLKVAIADDETARRAYSGIRSEADRLLTQPVLERQLEPRRPVLLPTSRRALQRALVLGLTARVEGSARHARRLQDELANVVGFGDWNPAHFLDVAEMAAAVAVGVDALGPSLEPAARATFALALDRLALQPGRATYRNPRGWHRVTHNWNLVCNGGLTLAALTVGDDAVLEQAIASARLAFASYAPDGAWVEGPSYWNYATRYAAMMCWALHNAQGHAVDLDATPGFAITGDFIRHMTGPTGLVFNWGDGGERIDPAGIGWHATRFARPADGALALGARDRTDLALALLAGARGGVSAVPVGLPTAARFQGIDVAALRTSWSDPAASYVAIKGGSNAANHGDLDLGTFVFDAGSQRWASDLGADDYALPGFFGRERWRYYRKNTEGQNTLLIGGESQSATAAAPITAFDADPRRMRVSIDLSGAYGRGAGSVLRHAELRADGTMRLRDDIATVESRDITWQMHTRAQPRVDGAVAVLERGGRRLALKLASAGRFELASAAREAPEANNAGINKLVIRLPTTSTSAARMIDVEFAPA